MGSEVSKDGTPTSNQQQQGSGGSNNEQHLRILLEEIMRSNEEERRLRDNALSKIKVLEERQRRSERDRAQQEADVLKKIMTLVNTVAADSATKANTVDILQQIQQKAKTESVGGINSYLAEIVGKKLDGLQPNQDVKIMLQVKSQGTADANVPSSAAAQRSGSQRGLVTAQDDPLMATHTGVTGIPSPPPFQNNRNTDVKSLLKIPEQLINNKCEGNHKYGPKNIPSCKTNETSKNVFKLDESMFTSGEKKVNNELTDTNKKGKLKNKQIPNKLIPHAVSESDLSCMFEAKKGNREDELCQDKHHHDNGPFLDRGPHPHRGDFKKREGQYTGNAKYKGQHFHKGMNKKDAGCARSNYQGTENQLEQSHEGDPTQGNVSCRDKGSQHRQLQPVSQYGNLNHGQVVPNSDPLYRNLYHEGQGFPQGQPRGKFNNRGQRGRGGSPYQDYSYNKRPFFQTRTQEGSDGGDFNNQGEHFQGYENQEGPAGGNFNYQKKNFQGYHNQEGPSGGNFNYQKRNFQGNQNQEGPPGGNFNYQKKNFQENQNQEGPTGDNFNYQKKHFQGYQNQEGPPGGNFNYQKMNFQGYQSPEGPAGNNFYYQKKNFQGNQNQEGPPGSNFNYQGKNNEQGWSWDGPHDNFNPPGWNLQKGGGYHQQYSHSQGEGPEGHGTREQHRVRGRGMRGSRRGEGGFHRSQSQPRYYPKPDPCFDPGCDECQKEMDPSDTGSMSERRSRGRGAFPKSRGRGGHQQRPGMNAEVCNKSVSPCALDKTVAPNKKKNKKDKVGAAPAVQAGAEDGNEANNQKEKKVLVCTLSWKDPSTQEGPVISFGVKDP